MYPLWKRVRNHRALPYLSLSSWPAVFLLRGEAPLAMSWPARGALIHSRSDASAVEAEGARDADADCECGEIAEKQR
uniref:Uncharacterized protein n=1 Tax=Pristionchus pacificus TaxID=54126 RepID=A0A2A6B554_PRIPA|eukprot:PDM60991.1 hypothetical protein PRIPAC_54797 [Pristionchus pacificus]